MTVAANLTADRCCAQGGLLDDASADRLLRVFARGGASCGLPLRESFAAERARGAHPDPAYVLPDRQPAARRATSVAARARGIHPGALNIQPQYRADEGAIPSCCDQYSLWRSCANDFGLADSRNAR